MPAQINPTDYQIINIAALYERQLAIPKDKPKHPFILCLVGLVGSGKTTVVKPLSEKLSLVRISGDEIRKLLKDHGHGYELTQDISTIVVRKYLGQGYSICSDSDCVTEKTQKILNVLKEEFSLKLVWIHISPPEEFILNKLSTYQGGWFGNDALIKNYHERKPLHKNLNFPFVYTFDTSKENLSIQIEEAGEIIRKFTKN